MQSTRSLRWFSAALAVISVVSVASAKDIYIAQNALGGNTGADAADAHAASWFNTAANWGSGSTQINPGDKVHLVGTFTAGITVQASGNPGNPTQIVFDPGANFTAPYINTFIELQSYNYLVIDGQNQGYLQNTANGVGQANTGGATGVDASPTIGYINIQNLRMTNLFTRPVNSTSTADGGNGVSIAGLNNPKNIVISNNVIINDEHGVWFTYGTASTSANWIICSNIIQGCNWHIGIADGVSSATLSGVNIFGNKLDYWGAWDQPSDYFHHNGIYIYGASGNSVVHNVNIYGNIIGPHFGQASYTSSGIFFYSNVGNGISGNIYDNLIYATQGGANDGFLMFWNGGPVLCANNTLDGGGVAPHAMYTLTSTVYFTNNIAVNFAGSTISGGDSVVTSHDYNCYYGSADSGLSETHAVHANPLFVSAAAANYNLQATSPCIGKGINLAGVFNTDLLGGIRSLSSPWDMGAFAYGAGSNTNVPPVVSAIAQNATDVDPNVSGLQVYEGSTVQYSATVTDGLPITSWQWTYSVNGGTPVVFQSGSGTPPAINYTYPAGSGGSTYVWTLQASDKNYSAQSQLTVGVETPPAPGQGLVFQAPSGVISGPFAVTGNYISQSVLTTVVASGGQATYTFTLTNSGNYVVQALVNCPDASANSFWVNIDAVPTDPNMIWDVNTTSGFEQRLVSWRGLGTDLSDQYVPAFFNLSAGTHTLYVVGREANAQLQAISILKVPNSPQRLRVL